MDQSEWIEYGIKNGWCSPPVCSTHDGIPTTALEDEEFDDTDPCIHIFRLYEDLDMKTAVEENYAPAVWRKHGFIYEES